MMSIEEHVEKLRESSEHIDSSQPVRVPEAMAPGDMLPQGDIGLLMLESLPAGCERFDWPEVDDVQLAPGTSLGSRHTIPRRFKDTMNLYRVRDGDPLSDTCLEATAPFDLEHPEHADHLGYPPGIYRVRHEQTAKRTRVID